MATRVEIRFEAFNPEDGEAISFGIDIPSKLWETPPLTVYTFRDTIVADTILIGGNLLKTISNTYEYLANRYSSYDWIEVNEVEDGVDILFYVTDFTESDLLLSLNTFVYFEEFTPETPITTADLAFVLSRSPYNVQVAPTASFDSAVLNIKIYRGERTVDAPLTDSYSLSKSVVKAGQSKINFEVHRLLGDFVKASMPTFGVGVNTSASGESVWAELELIVYYLDAEVGIMTQTLYVVDGFGYHVDMFNPTITSSVLSSITNHIIYRGSNYPLYFLTTGLVSITVNSVDAPFTLDEDYNNQFVSYINLGSYVASLTSFSVVFEYESVDITHTVEVKDACKYPLYNCFFKNKFGFWQSIPFNLLSRTILDVESSEYMPMISTYGQYSLASHNMQTYLPRGMEKITVNTDFIPESYNALFTEMMLSEKIYLENDGLVLPVTKKTNSLSKKTKVFDKLIQYTMDFEYSYNLMNTVI